MALTITIATISIVGVILLIMTTRIGDMVLSDADVWIILCIIALVLISFFLGRNSVLKELPEPKTMTINYEFRDSVYVPIDTVINNK